MPSSTARTFTDLGDYWACHAICVQRVEDEETYLKGLGR